MKEINQNISYKELENASELPAQLAELLVRARAATDSAYAPYSKFQVGAAVLLESGIIVTGSNQENASSPAGICAERVALSTASATHPSTAVTAIAISAKANDKKITSPVSPCGICRQTLLEYEHRFHRNIQIVLQGEEGTILWIASVKELLPLFFSRENLV